MPRGPLILCFAAFSVTAVADDAAQLGIRAPSGFEVTEFAGPALANDIFSLSIDRLGRVVVSGRGYIRVLMDDDGDGRADRALDCPHAPSDGVQGMLWEDSSLFVTGDGGLRRYRIHADTGLPDGDGELIRKFKTGGEHDAHDIKRGPDGWLYVLCGNMTGIDRAFAQSPGSPIRDPVAGCVIRFSPDLATSEVVADGFRNPYRMDWNEHGELFTFDSDNERCVSLPWYEPTRFYHVISSGHYGWLAPQLAQFWRMPPYFPDVVAPVATLGRGSPTGVVCYRHPQFPKEYRGAFFVADWTFGRVWLVPLQPLGSSYHSTPQVFLEAVGDNGFAPTDMAVHPATGDLYVSIGGRGTRGAVYRVRYPTGARPAAPHAIGGARPALDPDHTTPELFELGDDPDRPLDRDRLIALAGGGNDRARLRALQLVLRHRERFDSAEIRGIVQANWGHADRYVRVATSALIASLDDADRTPLRRLAKTMRQRATYYAATETGTRVDFLASDISQWRTADVEDRIAFVRLLQREDGDISAQKSQGTVWEGYTRRLTDDSPGAGATPADPAVPPPSSLVNAPWRSELRRGFPSGHSDLDREITRSLGMLEDDDPDVARAIADRLTARSDSVEDIHYLAVLARLRSDWTPQMVTRVATSLLALDQKCIDRHLNRDRHWPLRLTELAAELSRRHPGLQEAIVSNDEFGRPAHAIFALAEPQHRPRAARAFLRRAAADPEFDWNPALVELIGSLPEDESTGALRELWKIPSLHDAIIAVLARKPQSEDKPKFVAGLEAAQLETVREALAALESLPDSNDAQERLALVRTLRRMQNGKEEESLRGRAGRLLQQRTQQMIAPNDAKAWSDWFAKQYPELSKDLAGSDAVDSQTWARRLAEVNWSIGDAERGSRVFKRASCATCHAGARTVGPDLRGVANRFSRDDLFLAIIEPSRDVSPRYQTTRVATADGRVYQGIIIYEAVDSLILQTGAEATVRITNNQITDRRVTPSSLMPAGLLEKLSDSDIADLYAYLKGLR
jgi:putative heme-binding domain-containing protein